MIRKVISTTVNCNYHRSLRKLWVKVAISMCCFAISRLAYCDESKLTVEEAVRIAYQHSPKLRASQYEVKAGLAQIEREKPTAKPSVLTQAIGNLQGPRVTLSRGVGPDGLILPERYFRAEVSIEQPIYHAGSGAARTRYVAQASANRWEWQRACSDLAWDTHST